MSVEAHVFSDLIGRICDCSLTPEHWPPTLARLHRSMPLSRLLRSNYCQRVDLPIDRSGASWKPTLAQASAYSLRRTDCASRRSLDLREGKRSNAPVEIISDRLSKFASISVRCIRRFTDGAGD